MSSGERYRIPKITKAGSNPAMATPERSRAEKRAQRWEAKGRPGSQSARNLKRELDERTQAHEKEMKLMKKREELLMRTVVKQQAHMKEKDAFFRGIRADAESVRARGIRDSVWANEYVHGEEGEIIETAYARRPWQPKRN